jgi:predicted RNA binding protein YcfA (HicA-like mRNA interferase family)
MKFRDLIRLLESEGWRQVSQRGSHRQFKHGSRSGRVTVAGKPQQEVPPGTLRNILRQAGLNREDLP